MGRRPQESAPVANCGPLGDPMRGRQILMESLIAQG